MNAPFYQLGPPEQFRRVGTLARLALAHYNLGNVEVAPLNYGANATYRVTRLRDHERFVLRVHTPQRPTAQIRSELTWLDALYADGFTVPRAISSDEGERIITATVPEVPERRDCTLLAWVEGKVTRRRRTPELLRRIGTHIARLHVHSVRFRVPSNFARPRWDPDSLLDDPTWRVGWESLNSTQLNVFLQVADRFRTTALHLGAGDEQFGLIHGDFTFDNLLLYRGDVRLIDFDDCGFGYFLYDIATLLDRIEWRDDYWTLRRALLEGYSEERELPREHEALLDLFLLARWAFLGVAFLSAPAYSPGGAYSDRFLTIVVPKMRKYLRSL